MRGLLLKIGKPSHIKDMYDNEYLFFNSLSKFRTKSKDEEGRTDPREANVLNTQINHLEITTSKGIKIKLSEISKEFNAQYNEYPTDIPYNICSLYTFELDESLEFKKIDSRILKLGKNTLLISNLQEFFKSLENSIAGLHYEFSRKPVKYYDHKSFDGKLTLHHKDEEFSYQKEYRILIDTLGTEPLKIPIPGLKKFSAIVATNQLSSLKIDKQNGLQQHL